MTDSVETTTASPFVVARDIFRQFFSYGVVLGAAGVASLITVAFLGFTPMVLGICVAYAVAAGVMNAIFNVGPR